MTEANKKLSRRDAIKLLGAAAGATALANLPSKWSKPELASGVLPAHAQTSCIAVRLDVLAAENGTLQAGFLPGFLPVFPDEEGGAPQGESGYYATWYCQPGCLGIFFALGTASSGLVQLTILGSTLTLNLDVDPLNYWQVLIDMATGLHAYNTGGGLFTDCSELGHNISAKTI